MFICSKCKSKTTLPSCSVCGHTIVQENHVWQISDMPNLVTEGEGDKYIGYEHIGGNYSGSRKYLIQEEDAIVAREIADITGDGVFLDLACGDGRYTVPCADSGVEIIAGDISNNMLSILQKKAQLNNISLEKVTLCRMNALDIPLEDESVDAVVANSMLHLISSPEKVIKEIYRVLKKDGAFICTDDRPYKGDGKQIEFDNKIYIQRMHEIYDYYWECVKAQGIMPKKYSWQFDRDGVCQSLFASKTEKLIERGNFYEQPMKDWFLPRLCGQGFSDQSNVPKALHEEIIQEVLQVFKQKYGEGFADLSLKGIEDDLLITIYKK